MYGTTEILYFKIYNYTKQISKMNKENKIFIKQRKKKQKFMIILSPIYENDLRKF